jgi:hypothetical protein
MDFNHAHLKQPHSGVPGVMMLWHRCGGHAVRSGKRFAQAALNLLPRVIAGV